MVTVFEVDDRNHVVARSREEAATWWAGLAGEPPDIDSCYELTDAALDEHTITVDEDWEGIAPGDYSFRSVLERLLSAGWEPPFHFSESQ